MGTFYTPPGKNGTIILIACGEQMHTGSNEEEHNFDFVTKESGDKALVLVNFCHRQQDFIVTKGNPRSISTASDLGQANNQN